MNERMHSHVHSRDAGGSFAVPPVQNVLYILFRCGPAESVFKRTLYVSSATIYIFL